jgi:signal transduction histidine kinase
VAVISVHHDEAALVGSWDPGRLERVVGNLVGNAVKYSPGGGDSDLTLRREERADGQWGTISVRDHGLDIPAADLPHVFERFFRAGNVVGRFDGTGLGLAGVRQVVEQHGGTITVESREGHGTAFTVHLPLAPEG